MSITGSQDLRGAENPLDDLLVGIAGWSYPDWRGIVYAPGAASRSGGELTAIARLFDLVEINSTFYRFPEPRIAAGWARAVADRPRFRFTAKAPRELTHEPAAGIEPLRAGCRRLLEGLAPLLEAGRLEAVLAQFPPSVRAGPEAQGRMEAIVEALRPLPVAVEIRHPSFLKKGGAAAAGAPFLEFLERIGAGFVNADLPPGRGVLPPTTINTSALGYVRLHGRNAAAWFDRAAGRDQKYDYLYSLEELGEWTPRLRELARRTRRVFVVANNHFRGQAPASAIELLALLGKELPEEIPEGLLARYPRLRRLTAAGAARGGPLPEPGGSST